jgi:hypothetical protein
MLAGLLVLFSFGSVRNAFAGNFDFDGSRSVNESRIRIAPNARFQFSRPANFDFTNNLRNLGNFDNQSRNFDVAVKRDFDRNRNFDFANFDSNRFANRSGFDFVGNFDNSNADA